jgi:4-amino-4-deoxy-L-arabinose transferase-like glycosyltransferase
LVLAFAPFWGKAFHNDEPFFLAAAKHALSDPLHPLGFDFTWYGHVMPAAQINTTPPLLFYILAFAFKLAGGGEFAMRLALFPLDLAAAWSLYLLAARFLYKPLLPTLIVIAGPAYLINMNHLMPEKLSGALGFCGLCALVRGVDERSSRWFWGSAALLGAAAVSKYNAIVFLVPAVVYAWRRGVGAARIFKFGAVTAVPVAALVAFYWFFNPDLIHRALSVTTGSQASWWSAWPHKLRSFLAFVGGCGVVTLVWPLLLTRRKYAAIAFAAAAVLFLPSLDLPVLVRSIDRLTGIVMAGGAVLALTVCFSAQARRLRGYWFWASWLAAAGLLQFFFYWSIMARMVLFMLPPLVFLMAEQLEAAVKPKALEKLYVASLVVTLSLSVSLAAVDYRYAAAQKEFAQKMADDYLLQGRRVWYSGYMGLEYYLSQAGAQGLDFARGGWNMAGAGDVVAVLGINSAHLRPDHPMLSNVMSWDQSCAIPLRLMSGWTGEGGFYSNLSGFLPYSLSREPLERFTVVELK